MLQIRAFQPSDSWDERTALIDTWNDIDADDLSDTDVQVYVREALTMTQAAARPMERGSRL